MSWIMIGSAVIGAGGSYAAAKEQSKAQDKANAANMAGFNQYKPYVDAGLSGGQGAFNEALNAGYYQGPTYAGPNAFQTGTANTMGGYGQNVMNTGFGMMNTGAGFGQNYQDLYNQTQKDRLGTAIDYANENAGALTDSIMSDARRNTQLAMQGNNMSASGTGNANSSRAGIADAALQGDLARRTAATGAQVRNQMIDRSLNQQGQQFSDAMSANQGMQNAFTTGMGAMGTGADFGMNAGSFLQQQEQAKMLDDRERFEGDRDFAYNRYKDYMSGMLGKAPSTANQYQANTVSPGAAAVFGGMQGFGFGQQYGQEIRNRLPTTMGGYGSYGGGAPPMRPTSYGGPI